MQGKEFNPIHTARKIEEFYREYIATTIHFADADLQGQLEEILHRQGYLAKGPFLEAAPPYRKDKSVLELVEEGVLCRSMLKLGGGNPDQFNPVRPLYVHQVRAIRKAVDGRNYAVVTGTGSGKTESFLLPILNDILSEFETKGSSAGVRAMILYPMNALANDQLKRLRSLLEGTEITFGRYTGDTEETEAKALPKWKEENPGQKKLPNEIISRQEIRKNPPNILLTNYSMLEYLLLRPEDAPLFGGVFGSNWRHIAIDEAHIYSGALGTEIAYLLRRLKARIESETGQMPQLHCYATSATIGSEEDMPKVADFARDLFGEPFSSDPDDMDVITSEKDQPQDALDDKPWGRLALDAWIELRTLLQDGRTTSDALRSVLEKHGVPANVLSRMDGLGAALGLGKVLLGEESTGLLVRRCETLLDMTDPSAIDEIGIAGLFDDSDGDTLAAMVEVLSTAQRSDGVPILSSRYHSFLRAPEGIFLNLHTRRLTPHKTISEAYRDGDETPIYEVSVCRHCGQAYALGTQDSDNKAGTAWLNPRHEGTDADDEFMPRKYYRILADDGEKDPDEDVQWLCPICGSLHHERTGGAHRFGHEPVERVPVALNEIEGKQADEETARCRHCGYQSRVAIQPMRVSPEAAGSVVCYDLVREIPPFDNDEEPDEDDWFGADDVERKAGSVICFSDKRQDAAFFAPAMDRTYGSITRRQLIREAVEVNGGDGGCVPEAAINWIATVADRRYPGLMGSDEKGQATAWILDELAAEDSRNSLEGLGVIRIEPTAFNRGFEDPKVQKVVQKAIDQLSGSSFSWLSADDYVTLVKVCLELLRERNVIEVPEGVDQMRNNHEKRGNLVILGGESVSASKDVVQFAGSSTSATENKRSSFVRKYARRVHGVELGRGDSLRLLQSVFKFITQYLDGYFKGKGYLVGTKESFRLSKDLWRLYPHRDDDVVYRCDACGCETHLDANGVCTTSKCEGTMQRMTFAEAKDKDRFYKVVYQEEALPLDIEEHTAQLSSKKAREIQSAFIKGEVNVLSCTTTFELGVDVGDLRAIFMRNVPPSTANYTQRAGRVGRRAGMPGYAITFARLRPHDIAHFEDPSKIISGSTCVPMCYLDNEAIAIRHVFAVAMSEFFRMESGEKGRDYSHKYNDFMDLSAEEPIGLSELRDYLASKPERVSNQIERIIPEALPVFEELGIRDWDWVKLLVAPPADQEDDGGRLVRAHALKHADFVRVQQGVYDYMGEDEYKASSLMRSLGELKKEQTISILAENGILPKYGFPTDLVELHLPAIERSVEENRLSLSRGMRQAIREYAPGSEIVAGKALWRSAGIKKPKGHELKKRRYGKCPECGAFVWPIENYSDIGECPVCKTEFKLKSIMLIPSYGFEGKRVEKGVGLRRPRSRGYATVHFSQHWPSEASPDIVAFAGGRVQKRYAGNGQLCVLNAPRSGFHVCNYCSASAIGNEKIEHWGWCEKSGITPTISLYNALGTAFVSDVLELVFDLDSRIYAEPEEWEAVMWALFTAAAQILEIPETELGGTMYENEMGSTSVMIYDDVPGGAGHARQLNDRVHDLVEKAYRIVDGHCGCGDETCCYGCIANYYNQTRQSKLSRGAAKRILGSLLGY
ncbi:MAG: DEAD/DEAH box helicase [Eggerthellaceae bacterium]|nr:DEAD/DEAH box helicase [Eggerthellaceae bacterium]